jgi:hypothetical protein
MENAYDSMYSSFIFIIKIFIIKKVSILYINSKYKYLHDKFNTLYKKYKYLLINF